MTKILFRVDVLHPTLTWVVSEAILRHLRASVVPNLFINTFYMPIRHDIFLNNEDRCSTDNIMDKSIKSNLFRPMHPILTWVVLGAIIRHLKIFLDPNLFINALYMS